MTTDVLVIGGGMAGMLCASMLTQAGCPCVVAEAKRVGSGVTQNTTAKATAQHGLIYDQTIKQKGTEAARCYYEANQAAVEGLRAARPRRPLRLRGPNGLRVRRGHAGEPGARGLPPTSGWAFRTR